MNLLAKHRQLAQVPGPAIPPRHSSTSRREAGAVAADLQRDGAVTDDGTGGTCRRSSSAEVLVAPAAADHVARTGPEAAPDPGASGGARKPTADLVRRLQHAWDRTRALPPDPQLSLLGGEQ